MPINLYIANPRGFCAGVTNAINASNELFDYIDSHPIYFYHEIVHNNYLTNQLIKKGAIFVNDVDLVPDGQYVVFSAHGVSSKIEEIALRKCLKIIDLTCPLVTKVHKEIENYQKLGHNIIYIGDKNHHESKGTLGRLNTVQYYTIETIDDIKNCAEYFDQSQKLAYVTQTTLNVDKVRKIIEKLIEYFPNIIGANLEDICAATKNRQSALKKIIENYKIDLILTIGSTISSNSNKLVEIGRQQNIPSYLIENYDAIDDAWLHDKVLNIALTAGASAPEILINEVIEHLKKKFNTSINEIVFTTESTVFHPPKLFRDLKKNYIGIKK